MARTKFAASVGALLACLLAEVTSSTPMHMHERTQPCIPHGVALGAVARMAGTPSPGFHLDAWLAMANRRAYSALHDTPAYVTTTAFSDRHPSWDKFLLADVALTHSCAEYIWLLDASDAFIMNLSSSILPIIHAAAGDWRAARRSANRSTSDSEWPDVIVAHDCNGMNAGSLILRNTPWTRQHIAQAWFTIGPEVPDLSAFWEQAALRFLARDPAVSAHYHIIEQGRINAYPKAGCGAQYQTGDIAVHFPGIFKGSLAFDAGWLNKVPLESLNDGREIIYPRVYEVASFDGSRDDPADKLPLQFEFGGSKLAANFSCWREGRHTFNPGWPLPEPGMVQHIANAYLAEWHTKTFRMHGLAAVAGRGGSQRRVTDEPSGARFRRGPGP